MELLCKTDQINDRDARSFDTPQGEVIVASRDGMFYAYLNRCPHLGISLEFQEQQFMDMDHEYLMCANHGALFQVENGECVFGPCKNQSLKPIPIKVHSDGGIYLIEG
jgi:nitrite reductase/ring-hydroxylating ferredoxin subunit